MLTEAYFSIIATTSKSHGVGIEQDLDDDSSDFEPSSKQLKIVSSSSKGNFFVGIRTILYNLYEIYVFLCHVSFGHIQMCHVQLDVQEKVVHN